LTDITNGDVDLVHFLQRAVGYSLTGSIKEHALFFGYGTGANGKGVLTNTVGKILGDYHQTAAAETFTASLNGRSHHPTDTAGLRGARLVTAAETEEGRHWNEAKIKSVTGGDPIRTRFMYKDYFEYMPQFKLLISGNHKPSFKSVDESIRRRFHLIPFDVTVSAERRDKDLTGKLEAEWPGILAWMIEGCLEWQHVRLNPPNAVIKATGEYLDAEDSLANWLADECEVGRRGDFAATKDLFRSWTEWAERSGEHPGSKNGFSDKLVGKGFERGRLGTSSGGRGFHGIRLNRAQS
jgi:putative DNA primase/helicase